MARVDVQGRLKVCFALCGSQIRFEPGWLGSRHGEAPYELSMVTLKKPVFLSELDSFQKYRLVDGGLESVSMPSGSLASASLDSLRAL